MCDSCWNADKMKKKEEVCENEFIPFMTLEDLKQNLYKEWLEHGQTDFRIYKWALFEKPKKSLSWTVPSQIKENKTRLSVHFV